MNGYDTGEIEGRSYKSEDLWLLRDPEFFAKMMSQLSGTKRLVVHSKSLLQILINLQKYACSQDPDTFYFMNQKDACFKRVHTVLFTYSIISLIQLQKKLCACVNDNYTESGLYENTLYSDYVF